MFWKLLERFGVLGIQFVLQIVLARLLEPEHYGALSLMMIFTALANIFIQQGLNTALIQSKKVEDEDYSSVFWINLFIACAIYIILYALAPIIGEFYDMPYLIAPFRVLCLMLIPGALNSIQLAILSREMDFKKVFTGNLLAVVISGVVSIWMALIGAGLWALVVQMLLNNVIVCIVMLITLKWHPMFVFKFKRVKELFSYGWKLLVSGVLDTLYQDIQSLVIGKKYNSEMLGYYNRGQQFPQFIISAINSSIQSVLLPAMSSEQDDVKKVKVMTRNSVMLSTYIIFPMMAGLAAIAQPLIEILLTDKWLPSVPFMQISCFIFAFYPVHTSNLQAIKAVGRSDIFLKLEIVKKIISLFLLVIAICGFDTPMAIALSSAVGVPIGLIINAYPNKKLINYSYFEQVKDILPSFLISIIMFFVVNYVQMVELNVFVVLMLQIIVGILIYIIFSIVFNIKPFWLLINIVKNFISNKNIEENL